MSKIIFDDKWQTRMEEALNPENRLAICYSGKLPIDYENCHSIFCIMKERENKRKMIIAGEPKSLTSKYKEIKGLKLLITDSIDILEEMPKDKDILVLFIEKNTTLEHIQKQLDNIGKDIKSKGFDDFWESAMKDPKKKAEIDAVMLPRLRDKTPAVICYGGYLPKDFINCTPIFCILKKVENIGRMISNKYSKEIHDFYRGKVGLEFIISDDENVLNDLPENMKSKFINLNNISDEEMIKIIIS